MTTGQLSMTGDPNLGYEQLRREQPTRVTVRDNVIYGAFLAVSAIFNLVERIQERTLP